MGCTANIAYFDDQSKQVYLANLGDSKAMYCKFDKGTGEIEAYPLG